MSARALHARVDAAAWRDERSLARLVRAAAAGDRQAWDHLVRKANPIVRRVAAGFKLRSADIDDAAQNTWVCAYGRLHTLREPEAFAGWITVIARREALRAFQHHAQEVLVDDFTCLERSDERPLEESLIARETVEAVHGAVGRLPEHQRRLLGWTLANPGACYSEISVELKMPIGSIGPTRERALARLRRDAKLAALAAA
jgi:RNA polymerase sigma factor (sigma-70 family)